MQTTKRLLVIADIKSTVTSNGDRTMTVDNGQKIICDKNLVGLLTQQFGQSMNIVFNNSISIDKMYYNQQKYCYVDSKLYEIKSIGKAKLEKDMLLNVVEITDSKIVAAIISWLGG